MLDRADNLYICDIGNNRVRRRDAASGIITTFSGNGETADTPDEAPLTAPLRGPRSIDIDILFFGDREINEPGLIVPHPRLTERAFVLVPLAEIAPDTMQKGKSVAELAQLSDQTGMMIQKGPDWY